MWRLGVVLLLTALPGSASAQSMPVSQFLAKAEALQKKGPMALFSKDIGILKAEVANSGKLMKAERERAKRSGRTPAYCPPEKASLNSDELLAYLRTIPPAQRGMSIKDAFGGMMRRKYPCPA